MLVAAPNVVLRPWQPDDAEALAAIANDRSVWINLRDRFPHPYTLDDARSWIAFASGQADPLTHPAVVVGGAVAGGMGLMPLDDVNRITVEIGYWLGRDFRGRGVATAAVRALTAYAFDVLGFERVEAPIFAWNPASGRVLEKAGYVLEGRFRRRMIKDGRIDDELLYARVREP
jgi:ribosomal-protein-alanine N-acetyltransferase